MMAFFFSPFLMALSICSLNVNGVKRAGLMQRFCSLPSVVHVV